MYVVECADGTLYTGYTTDAQHAQTHTQAKAPHTRAATATSYL